MRKSKIEKRLPEPQHSKEQKDDATSVRPAIAKPRVVRSPKSVSTEYDKILVSNGFNKNEHGAYVLCHKETDYRFYLSSNFASCRALWLGSPMTSIFHGMSVDNIDDLNYLIKNVLVKIPNLMAKTP